MNGSEIFQIVALNGTEPPRWTSFGQRWRQWRHGFDRAHWSSSWQGQAWVQGALHFPSPWDNGHLATRLSVRKGLVFGYVLQQGDHRALVLPGWLGGGHELEAVFLLRERVLLLLPCSLATPDWFLLVLAELLPALVTQHPWPAIQDQHRPQRLILEGHPNFAHQVLNVLSALEDLDNSDQPLHWLGAQPFGPVQELFPGNNWLEPTTTSVPGQVFELPLSQRPATISTACRKRIRTYCDQQLSDGARALLSRLQLWRHAGGQVLWVSLKTRGAWAEGLPELVAAWMHELHRRGRPLPLVLLDGFSMQEGDTLEHTYYDCSLSDLLLEERLQAAQVKSQVSRFDLQVEEAIGLRLAETIALGRAVDGYFCHQGTVQHKLGWFQETVPGVVHSSSWRSKEGPHPWGGMGGLEPLWLPNRFSEDLAEGPRAPYRFRSEQQEQAACWLADHAPWRAHGYAP